MNLTPLPPNDSVSETTEPTNIVSLGGDEIEITLKEQPAKYKCSGVHKEIIVDEISRTVRCEKCGFAVDPFDYLLSWASAADHRMKGLKAAGIKTRIQIAEFEDLKRKCDNMRVQLKRGGQPQLEIERQHWNNERLNAPYRAEKFTGET